MASASPLRRTSITQNVCALLALCAIGCGQTVRDGIESVRPELAPIRQHWAALATSLPPPGTLPPLDTSTLAVPLVFDEASSEARNVEAVMIDHLIDPDTRLDSSHVDLVLSGMLHTCVRWTGPRNPMAESAMSERRGEQIASQCRAAAAWPYLLALRPVRFERPSAVDTATYTPGSLVLEAILVDTTTWTPRGALVVQGQSAAEVSYRIEAGRSAEDARSAMESTAYSTMWSSARVALAAQLTRGASRFVAD